MPNTVVTGKVTSCASKPTRGFTVGPPPDPAVIFADVDSDDYATALAAYAKNSDVDVTSDGATPPACLGVKAK